MAQPSTLPSNLMTCSLLHFEHGIPIDDLNIRTEHKRRLARVSHVYWIWKKNNLKKNKRSNGTVYTVYF